MEDRIKIYLGNVYEHSFTVNLNDPSTEIFRPFVYCFNEFRNRPFPLTKTTYYHDLTRFIFPYPNLYDSTFLFYPHDRVEPFPVPTFVKSRPINDPGNSILLNMNYLRHFKEVFEIKNLDMAYCEKRDLLVWRGGCTGYGFGNNIPKRAVSRQRLIEMFPLTTQHIDIGLSHFDKTKYKDFLNYEKPRLTIAEQLEAKFILSIEGNDVATNLKWILYSNSVPVCPPFTIQSWILEDQLVPFQHYIPVRADFSDLEEKIEWGIDHPELCSEIAKNGKEYIRPFLDLESEEKIRKEILSRYSENVTVIK
jgi:hypothetical protein